MIGRYTLYPEHGYVDEVIEGEVTLSEMADFVEQVISDPDWNPEFHGIVDFSRAHLNLTYEELATISKSLRNDIRAGRGHCAFIVSSTLSYGVIRMFEALSDDSLIVQIFRERAQAEAWIREVAVRSQHNQA